MDKSFSSDKPIFLKIDDKFQRYNFSQRIAKTIVDRENEECIVIGVYGAWGEGKTSVINFIETELKENENIIIIKFNPWRYSNEDMLLMQFFQKLAEALNIKLKTQKEKIGQLLHKYGKLLKIDIPFVGNIGEAVESAGEILSETDIEIIKSRINTIIQENKNKLVVFIDDIDRLDKNEIHSIFRLVKLTADFSNTTYILSFDESMVSSAIGDRFGEGNQKAGQNFLEKIIQVPLKIPVAQPDALKQFCFGLVDNALNSTGVEINEDEARRFVSEFTDSILLKLDTPRLAVRYGNTLSFSLPLLHGEVNTVDLMLIEAVKIFYPSHYEFIKLNPDYFISTYSDRYSNNRSNEKINQIKEHFDKLNKGLSIRQSRSVQNLLEELFPRLKEAFGNYYHDNNSELDWFKKKRIVSTKYFNRYFSYAVIKGEVSDVAFQNFISSISRQQEQETINSIQELVSISSPDNFIQKLRTIEEEFTWDTSTRISKALSKCSDIFPKKTNDFFSMGFGSPNSQAAIFIYKLLKMHDNKAESLELARELLKTAIPFEFAFELNKWFINGDSEEKKMYAKSDNLELGFVLLERSLKEAGELPLYKKFPDISNFLYSTWAEKDKPSLDKYMEKLFEADTKNCLELLISFTPVMRSSAYPEPYKSDFSKKQYDYFTSIFDRDLVYKSIMKKYSDEVIGNKEIKWEGHDGHYQTELNIVRQFLHWDNETKKMSIEN